MPPSPVERNQRAVSAPPGGEAFTLRADQAPVMLWRSDPSRGCDHVNHAWLDFTGRTLDQERGDGWTEGVHPEDLDRCLATYAEAFDARRPYTMEYRLRRRDGAWRWVLASGCPFETEEGRFGGYHGSCVDVTELRQALEERRQMLRERDALLTELLHRVKNNAQATTSFLALQATRAEDPAVAQALRAAATRVMLSSLAQDRMFRLAGAAWVEIGPEVAAAARQAGEIAGRHGVAVQACIEDRLCVQAARATPLVLMVNELVVNALGHGFPDGRAGRVRVTVRRPAPGLGDILVEDDGIGAAPDLLVRPPRSCLGLNLVRRLARQAGATIRVDAVERSGVRAVLTFLANPWRGPDT